MGNSKVLRGGIPSNGGVLLDYIVEMQVAKVAGFEKRAQYYAAKAYSAQPESGDTYDHLKEVIFLAITEYEMFKDKEGYKSVHIVLDKKTHERDLKDFSFTFLELKKFHKSKEELKTYEDKWLYFFKHANDPEDMHKLIENSDEVIKKAYNELEAHNWTNEELRAYEASEKSSKDAKAREQYVEQEGRKKGREEGREERNKEIAKNLLVQKMDIKLISELTGLPVEKIKKLEKETNG